MIKKKKYSYYQIDSGCYPNIFKLCFTKEQYDDIIKDHKVEDPMEPLENGCAETHILELDHNRKMIVLIFDLDYIIKQFGIEGLAGTVAHEVSHAVDHLAEYIGEESNLTGGETRAYLTEHFVNQIFKASILESQNNDRKRTREKVKEGSGIKGWSNFQMDFHSHWGSRPDSLPEEKRVVRGDEDKVWGNIPKTGTHIQDT